MSRTVSLPPLDRLFEIRFESIGGLGADAAGQVLATAAVLRMGLNGTHFSSYGLERKGGLVRSFVRLGPADAPIRTSAPVEAPNAIVIFHAALLHNPSTLAGLVEGGTLIYNAPPGPVPAELAALPRTARVIRVDALGIAAKEQSRPATVLLGTLCGAFPFLDAGNVLEALSEELANRNPEAVAFDECAFRRGGAEFETLQSAGRAEGNLPIACVEPVWGYETQPIGGIILEPGSTVWNDLSAARTGSLPVFNRERCIHCGLCDLVCPDYCLVWDDGENGGRFTRELIGVDYRYCKGCLRCVESCPASAMTRKTETAGLANRLRVPLFPDLIE
jgi:pyruvate ferredoxin oxidoreductase gamma subunit